MRVGVVMPLAEQRGGVERMLTNLLTANARAPRADYSVAFLEKGPLVDEARALGYPATVIEAGRLRDLAAYLRARRSIGEWMDGGDFDAILSWAAKAHLYAGPPARRRALPASWWVHGLPDGSWMDRLVTAIPADLVLCCSHGAEDAQRRLRPARLTRVVPISVDLAQFDPDSLPSPDVARRRLGLPPDGPVVTMVARLQKWKGVHVFVAAALRLLRRLPEATFVVVGGEHPTEPDYPAELERQVAGGAAQDRIRLVGLQADVPLWMQAADIVVHASFDEPAGAVIIEGMALGKSVVAARTAGPMEFITDNVDGRLAAPGDDAELATVIGELLDDGALRSRLGRAARARAREFGSDRFSANVAEAMASLVADRTGPVSA